MVVDGLSFKEKWIPLLTSFSTVTTLSGCYGDDTTKGIMWFSWKGCLYFLSYIETKYLMSKANLLPYCPIGMCKMLYKLLFMDP